MGSYCPGTLPISEEQDSSRRQLRPLRRNLAEETNTEFHLLSYLSPRQYARLMQGVTALFGKTP